MLQRFIDGTALLSIEWTVQKLDNVDRTHLVLLSSTTKKLAFVSAKLEQFMSKMTNVKQGRRALNRGTRTLYCIRIISDNCLCYVTGLRHLAGGSTGPGDSLLRFDLQEKN